MWQCCILFWLLALGVYSDETTTTSTTAANVTATTTTTTLPAFCTSVEGRECTLNPQFDKVMSWDGDIVLPEKSSYSYPHNAEFHVTGKIILRFSSRLIAANGLKIFSSGWVCESCWMEASYVATSTAPGNCSQGVNISSGILTAKRGFTIACHDGVVNITGMTIVKVGTPQSLKPRKFVVVANDLLCADNNVNVQADIMDLYAYQHLHLAAIPDAKSDLQLRSAGSMILGWDGGGWSVHSLTAVAYRLSVADDHRIEVVGTDSIPAPARACGGR
ncbi:unnamed protein product [Symbiodinium natans]|uniref:Uncharacterized protein n=1 Tax=Symbiodinium natans TaxID=878477 RepID=A0A812JEQ5_9DINO|nr:unnamed protein product [Symbiodinium natans]